MRFRTVRMDPEEARRAEGRPPAEPAPPARTRAGLGWMALVGGIVVALAVMLVLWLVL